MKKLVLLSTLALTTSAFAQDAKTLKEMSIQACEAQVAQLPENQQKTVMATCKCTVENTDYDAMAEASQGGDLEKIQADALAVAQKCAAEADAG